MLNSLFGADAEILHERNFQLLLLANILGPLSSALLSPVLDSLTGPFRVSAAEVGLIISALTAPGIVMIPIAGVLADRYGRKPVLLVGLVLFGIGGSAIAFTTNFTVVLGLRVLQGIGFAGLVPIIITSLGDLYAGTQEATAQGIRFTGSGLTQTIFPLLSGILVLFAWQYPFLIYAISFPVAVLIWLYLPEPQAVSQPPEPVPDGGVSSPWSLFDLLRNRRVVAMVIARGLPVVVWIGFMTYNSIIVVRLMGGTPAEAGVLVAIGSLAFGTAASQAGRITAMFTSRYYPLIVANLCLGAGFVLVLFSFSLWFAMLGIMVAGIGFGLTLSLYRSIITGLAPAQLRGGLVSTAEGFGRVTATLTPVVMGGIISGVTPVVGFSAAVQVAGVFAAIVGSGGGIVCLFVVRRSPDVPVPDFYG